MNDRPPALRESEVMGRAPVLVLFSLTGAVGALRLLGVDVSSVIAELRAYGGLAVELVWAVGVVTAWLVALVAWVLPARRENDRAMVEIVALLIHALTTAYYAFAVALAVGEPSQAMYLLAFLVASIVNCTGRAVLLGRRMRWVTKAVR